MMEIKDVIDCFCLFEKIFQILTFIHTENRTKYHNHHEQYKVTIKHNETEMWRRNSVELFPR